MRECVTVAADTAPLIPTKRVNYTFGMVLGVDDFRQEQVHFEWKHQLSNRLLHGYGTVCGLQVSAQAVTNPPDVEIRISPGYGLSPQGKWMWVEHDQCARLGAWLQRQDVTLSPPLSPGRYTIYVHLCYVECETDLVPIAGQACAAEADTRAPSRLQEAFRAEFAWTPPPQPAEDRIRRFGDLLARVEVVTETASPVAADDSAYFLELVRSLAVETSPPAGSPPDAERLQLAAATACETIRQALTIWTTEVCPHLHPVPGAEDCILLACIHFDVDASGNLDFTVDAMGNLVPGSVQVDDCERPILVPERLKQELFCLIGRDTSDHGILSGLMDDDHPQYLTDAEGDARYAPLDHTHALDDLSDVNAPVPNEGQVLTWNSESMQWEPRAPSISVTDHGALNGLADDDHPQYLLTSGARPLTGNLSAGGNRITNLGAATAVGEAVPFQQAIKQNDAAGGDLTGPYPNPTVARLRGRDVASTQPTNGQVLAWNEAAVQWQPQTSTAAGNFVEAPAGRYAIVAAGFFDTQGAPQGPVYNELQATPAGQRGDYLLSFPDYRLPDQSFMYIVKGTVQDTPQPGRSPAIFRFVEFNERGILVRVLAADNETQAPGFMVEISLFSGVRLPR